MVYLLRSQINCIETKGWKYRSEHVPKYWRSGVGGRKRLRDVSSVRIRADYRPKNEGKCAVVSFNLRVDVSKYRVIMSFRIR